MSLKIRIALVVLKEIITYWPTIISIGRKEFGSMKDAVKRMKIATEVDAKYGENYHA